MTSPPVELGRRFVVKPRDVEALRPLETIQMALSVLRGSPELQLIRDRVDFDDGRPRQLAVDVLIAASIATAATHQSNMHVRGVAALLRALPVADQRVLGVRWTDPNGGGERLITERQVAYLFERVAVAFNDADARHNHLFVLDNEVWTPDGEYVCDISDIPLAQQAMLDCAPSCPMAVSMQDLGNRLLTAFWEYTGMPASDCFAIDSSVVETHFAPRSYGNVADIDPDYVAENDRQLVANFRQKASRKIQGKGPITKATRKYVDDAYAAWARSPKQPKDRKSRKPDQVGPVVKGDFHSTSADFPQVGPDGRLVHTKDAGARSAYRGAGASRKSQVTNGRDQHVLVAAGPLPDGTPFPPLNRAYNATAGGYDKGDSILGLLDTAVANGVTPCTFTADRISTAVPPERFAHTANARGWTLVRDLKDAQRKPKQWLEGVNYEDGWWFTSGMPSGLVQLPRWPAICTREVRAEHQAAFDRRRPYMFRVNARYPDGRIRLRGPAVPDHVTYRKASGEAIAVRGMRARCVNSPYFDLVPRTVPQTECVKGKPCGCSTTFTVRADEIPNSCEPLLGGSTKWAKEYARRNLSEASFSLDEYHYGRDRHSIRVRAHKWDFAFAMLTLANFVRTFHSWVMRQGAHALDPGYYSALDPAVFTPAVARAMRPATAVATSSPRTSAPPGG